MGERLSADRTPERLGWPEFNLHHATVLFVASFNHSQGSENLQDWLFEYLHWLHPEVRISEAFKNEIKAHTHTIVHRLLAIDGDQLHSGHQPVSRDDVDLFLDKESHRMQATFNEEPPPLHRLSAQELLAQIAYDVVEREHRYIVAVPDGRPNRRGRRCLDSRSPSHWCSASYSYVVEHALRRRPTEAPEFDRMYAEIGQVYRRALVTNNAKRTLLNQTHSQLLEIVHGYNRDHPKSRVFLSKLR